MNDRLTAFVTRRLFAVLALVGTVLTGVLGVTGQIDHNSHLNHITLTVSDFAVADRGGPTDWAMVLFGASGLALNFALRPCRLAAFSLLVFGASMVVTAVFPTDVGTDLSTTGYVHRYASVSAFVALPVAALLIARRFPGTVAVRWAHGLVLASGVFMVLMLGSAWAADRALLGLIERLLIGSELVLLGLLAWLAGPGRLGSPR